MNSHFQDLFIEDQANDAEYTIELLKTWLISKFPPPPMKHEWLFKLRSIKMRKNEDPKLVYDKFNTILSRIDDAISLINTNRDRLGRVRGVTNEQVLDALSAIFVRNNNNPKFDNNGEINRKVVGYIYKTDPKTTDDWKDMFNEMKNKLIPNVFKSLKEWQYVTYPTNISDYDIYKKPSKRPEDNKADHKIPRKETTKKRKRKQTLKGGNKKRKYNQYCGRCGRNNHPESECFATHDVFGKSLNRNNHHNNNNNTNNRQSKGKKYCKRCKRNNHYTSDCNASYYADRTPINDGKFQQKRYRNNHNNNNNNNQNTKEFQTRKQRDDMSTKDLMALLSQRISNDDELNAQQQFECLSTLTDLNKNISARQDGQS